MDIQQMTQQLLARMDADREVWKADRIVDREYMKHMNAELKADQEDLKRMMEEINAKMDTNQAKATKQEEMLAEISAEWAQI
jgi:hypothetical protein